MGVLRKATFAATGGASGLFIKANSKKERMANAAEQQLALERKAIKEEQARQAAEKIRREIAAGAWWLEPGTFVFGMSLDRTRYLGGWPRQEPDGDPQPRNLVLDPKGLRLKGVVKTIFTIPWSDIAALGFEDIDSAAVRPTLAAAIAAQGEGRRPSRQWSWPERVVGKRPCSLSSGEAPPSYR